MTGTAEKADPQLWDRVKRKVTREDKGGRPGQWSARKAQRAVQEYKGRGGRYKGDKQPDNHLAQWTREDWGTRSGKTSRRTGERYLPKRVRDSLSENEYKRTTARKRADTAKGRQFSRQPADVAAKSATIRRSAGATRAELMKIAARHGIEGRFAMKKADLQHAIERATQ